MKRIKLIILEKGNDHIYKILEMRIINHTGIDIDHTENGVDPRYMRLIILKIILISLVMVLIIPERRYPRDEIDHTRNQTGFNIFIPSHSFASRF